MDARGIGDSETLWSLWGLWDLEANKAQRGAG